MKFFILLFLIFHSQAFCKTIKIGLVFDGKEESSKNLVDLIKNSLQVVLDNPKSVIISTQDYGDEDIPKIKENFKKVMENKVVNLVIVIGPIGSYVASLTKELIKPVISTHLFDRTLANKKNLAALKVYPDLEEIKNHFQEIDAGKNILVVSRNRDPLKSYWDQIQKVLGVDYSLKFYLTDEPLAPGGLDGINLVFYLPSPFENKDDFPIFQKTVNEKNIPSYSLSGIDDFKNGVLVAPEIINFNERLSRVIALSVMEYMQGKPIEKLEQKFITFKKIVTNKEIATAFGSNMENLAIISTEGGQKEVTQQLPNLTLKEAVSKTLDQNFNFQSSKYAFEQSEYQAKSKFTKFFPQIGLEGVSDLYKQPDSILLTRTTEDINALNINLRQFIFSDNTLSDYSVSKYTRDQYQYKNDEVRIDVIASTVQKYIQTLNLSSIIKIREENLALTSENLQIAELNFKTGKSSKFEVYRWESQLADNKKDLASSNFEYNTALHELNRLMNVPLANKYNLEVYEELQKLLVDNEVHLPSKYKNMNSLEKYISFVIEESKATYPLFKDVEQSVKIAERLLLNKDRAFFLPRFELFSDYFFLIGENPWADVSTSNDFRVGIRLSFPLFESLNKFYERSAEVRRLSYAQTNKSDIYQQVEKTLRDQIVGIRTSFEQIKYEIEREKAAKSNLDLIKLSYKTGKVDILFLLDAQNFYLRAREGVVIAKNNFLLELIKLERSMGDFSFLRDTNQSKEFHDRYRKFMGLKAE